MIGYPTTFALNEHIYQFSHISAIFDHICGVLMWFSFKISTEATLIDFDSSIVHIHTCFKHFYIKLCVFRVLGPCIEHKF